MATELFFRSVPCDKTLLTLALEAGATGLIVPEASRETAAALARCLILADGDVLHLHLGKEAGSAQEDQAAQALAAGRSVLLRADWEVIPVENLLARRSRILNQMSGQVSGQASTQASTQTSGQTPGLIILEVTSPDQARLAAAILEHGVCAVLLQAEQLEQASEIAAALQGGPERLELAEAEIVSVSAVGLGHRVCVDTLSNFQSGQGMLLGNSAAFTFLVNAETEPNAYVAARPFRINAGAVHSYALMPGDRTAYLADLRSGQEILTLRHNGECGRAIIGRLKVERRPMLQITARSQGREGSVFLQNAETIRLVRPGGETASVVALQVGDRVLCRLDEAGRHFGLRVSEDITE